MMMPLPRLSYRRLRQVIEAYYKIEKEMIASKDIYHFMGNKIRYDGIAGTPKFLMSINLLESTKTKGYYKITNRCKELGKVIEIEDKKGEARILREIIRSHPVLKKILERIEYLTRLNTYIERDVLKKYILSASGWKDTKDNFDTDCVTIVTIFEEAKIIYSINKKRLGINRETEPIEFISSEYIYKLKDLESTSKFSLVRLIHYCQQINENYQRGNFESVAFLSRAIIHHIPPIFGQQNFQSLAQVSSGDSSFKKSCRHLQESLKHIVDDLIHHPITNSETRLAEQEINFSQDLNRLIRAIIDKLRSP